MIPIQTPQEVFDAVAQVKAGASGFCTNFYPAQPKLEAWIARKELWIHPGEAATFFFRKDRDFWHLSFCARDGDALERGLADLPQLKSERVVSDVIGTAGARDEILPIMERAGLRTFKQLVRMARLSRHEIPPPGDAPWNEQIAFADEPDAAAALCLIQEGFDLYAKQIPCPEEIQAAIGARQILILKLGSNLAGLLFFETHGATSTLRFWTVAQRFRDRHVGSTLMRHYLATQTAVRRFVLWVNTDNPNAIHKYRHYHYSTDGVVDHVMANRGIFE